MHSLFIGFKTHAAFSIQKGRLSLIFFKRNFSFPQLFFFFFFKETKNPHQLRNASQLAPCLLRGLSRATNLPHPLRE